jgi:hypothetical protein
MTSRTTRLRLGIGFAGLLLAARVSAQHGPPITIGDRGRGASLVAVGTVENSVSLYRTNKYGDNLIVSQLLVRVSEFLKGAGPGYLTLEVEGGTVNGITMKTSDLPELRPGDTVVFFLDRDASGDYTPHLRGYGLLRLDGRGAVENSSLTVAQIRAELQGAGR